MKLAPGMERRAFKLEKRTITKTEKNIVMEGYAAVFNSPSDSGGMAGFQEVIRNGAFKKAILECDVRALFNHDANYVLGRNKAGTLEMNEDEHGLHVRISAPLTPFNESLATSMERGDIDQMSFNFAFWDVEKGQRWNWESNPVTRELIEVRLFDVSVVTYAWYEDTEVSVRSSAKSSFEEARATFEKAKEAANKTAENTTDQNANKRRLLELKLKEV